MSPSTLLEVRAEILTDPDIKKIKTFWRRELRKAALGSPVFNLARRMLSDLNNPVFVKDLQAELEVLA